MQENNTKEDSQTEIVESKYWQWIKGELTGTVVTIKDIDDKWINFVEGGRLSKSLRDEFIQPLEEDLAQEFKKTEPHKVIPPATVQKITGDVSISKKEISPIRVLFNKQKKNNKVKLLLEFPVNIPQKAIYELMSTSFDKDEVNDILQSFILDQLSEDEILDCLHNSVQSLIDNKYKGE